MAAELNEKIVKNVNSLMLEDKAKTQSTFDKVSPLVNEIFIALANYDVRFEFSLLSLDSGKVEKVLENEYNVLCPLQELPEDNLRLEGKDGTGVLTVRLSRACEDSIDKVCWNDISLPPDSKGCRYFSTSKLLKVLIGCVKHAISDVIPSDEETNDKDKCVTCKEKNNMAVLKVKVSNHSMRFNLLPCIPLNPTVMKSLSMEGRISRITKHMKFETPECAYLVAKPFPTHSENLWRITVNNIENNIAQKISDATECGGQCIFALTLLSEQFLAEKKNKGMVSYYLIRMALLQEFLKFPNAMYWKADYFTVRLDSLLRSLEAHVSRKDFKNIFTGVNMISHREKEKLMELLNDVARLREQFMRYFS